jgi:hypothetical protein
MLTCKTFGTWFSASIGLFRLINEPFVDTDGLGPGLGSVRGRSPCRASRCCAHPRLLPALNRNMVGLIVTKGKLLLLLLLQLAIGASRPHVIRTNHRRVSRSNLLLFGRANPIRLFISRPCHRHRYEAPSYLRFPTVVA